ncbi:hypothetical protein O9Z70_15965 [Devosia sp. YIM 151766]|uniref:hypothetical protein n=1 Tax=Devosia sp. YIM 151766 TaxID=3017325 RepID=UPI00255CC0BD|nr:hypothetical protein [Devosia sp. YIM 151766]WIY52925.1 hypothetical protein O9Z70_15965 [Devosia sp. YIM 151766]
MRLARIAIALTMALVPVNTLAQQDAAMPSLLIELNAIEAADAGCKVTFLATNGLEAPIDRTALEVALFRADGAIERMVTLEFKALPQGKTKVLQFQVPALDCDNLGRILINDVKACEGPELNVDMCFDRLETRALPAFAFGV